MTLENLLKQYKTHFAPLFQPDLTPENTLLLDFSVHNPEMKHLNFNDTEGLNGFVFEKISQNKKSYGYGGYMEDREIYRRSTLFALLPEQARSIHLGIDVWTPAGTAVYAPLDARVHSFANNANYGDYGPTIILEHELDQRLFYTLYGHLDLESIQKLQPGKKIEQGEVLCRVGNYPVNGDWPPHLHFQIIAQIDNKTGDYPGVCSQAEKARYKQLCPDPLVFFKLLG